MQLTNKTILVTGANRGIGEAIVRELLKHGVTKIYAAARKTSNLPDFGDTRVTPLALDITNRAQIDAAANVAGDVHVLINNAGLLSFANVVSSSTSDLAADMNVNYFGTLSMMNAFAPVIERNKGGIIANVISVLGLASMASVGAYSASKAALFSATQAARTELKAKQIAVVGIFPGPIDTDMSKEFLMAKASPASAAEAIIKGLQQDDEDIFPDAMSQNVGQLWAKDPKALEKQFAGF